MKADVIRECLPAVASLLMPLWSPATFLICAQEEVEEGEISKEDKDTKRRADFLEAQAEQKVSHAS